MGTSNKVKKINKNCQVIIRGHDSKMRLNVKSWFIISRLTLTNQFIIHLITNYRYTNKDFLTSIAIFLEMWLFFTVNVKSEIVEIFKFEPLLQI